MRKTLTNSLAALASGNHLVGRELELGYWLVNEHHGKGYALEACQQCIDYARAALSTNSLVGYIDPSNAASIGLAKRLGAVSEGAVELASYGPHCVFRYF